MWARGIAIAALATWPATASATSATGLVRVTVTENKTDLGWFYEYHVINTSIDREIKSLTVGFHRRAKGAGSETAGLTTIGTPFGWTATRLQDPGGYALVRWHRIEGDVPGPAIAPRYTWEGFDLLFEERCLWCIEAHTAFEAQQVDYGVIDGAVEVLPGRPSAPLRVKIDDPYPGTQVSATVRIKASVSDPARVQDVRFEAEGRPIPLAPDSRLDALWDTHDTDYDGDWAVQATVKDAKGRTYLSQPVVYVVQLDPNAFRVKPTVMY